MNFLFGGKLIVGRGALVAEGTSIEGTAQGILGVVNDGNGGEASPKYSVDFAVGAHIDAVPADVVFDYAAAAAFSDYRATYPACGFIVADAEFKEIIKYGPVTIYWYVGNKANYMADAANVVKQTSYFGKLPIAPTSALADIKIGNATLEFAGWSDTYVYYGNYTDYESYLAATEGIIAEIVAITENDIIANGSTRAYFPVYTLKSVSVTHTWVDFLGNTLKTQTVDEGDEAPDFEDAVPTHNTGVVLLTHNGEWDVFATAESVTYVPCYETKASVDTSGSTVSMSYSNDFSLKLTLTETVYSVLSENDKARFEKAGSVYTVSVDRDLNQMFTPAKFNFTVESEGYTASVSFSTSVYDYTAELLENAGQAPEARKAAYYVLAYMKAAYEYFDVKDNYNYDFSILTEYRDVVSESDFTIPENTTDHSALSGKFYVALILTSRHNTVIGVTNPEYAGKVKVNGVEMELTDGEVVLEAMNENITGTLILELDENGDEVYEVNGTYCILDYQAGLANTEAAEVVNALVNFAYYINTLG